MGVDSCTSTPCTVTHQLEHFSNSYGLLGAPSDQACTWSSFRTRIQDKPRNLHLRAYSCISCWTLLIPSWQLLAAAWRSCQCALQHQGTFLQAMLCSILRTNPHSMFVVPLLHASLGNQATANACCSHVSTRACWPALIADFVPEDHHAKTFQTSRLTMHSAVVHHQQEHWLSPCLLLVPVCDSENTGRCCFTQACISP